MGKRGQGVIVGIIFFFIAIAIFAVLSKPLMEFIEVGVNSTTGTVHGELMAMILNYIPVMFALMLFVVGVLMMTGRQR